MLPFGKTPIVEASRLEAMGYKFIVASIDTLLFAARALSDLAETFHRDGHTLGHQASMMSFDEFKLLLGVEDFLGLRQNLRPD
jgi:2-methylisocitrate lyase-like PEP mutase family enzyme